MVDSIDKFKIFLTGVLFVMISCKTESKKEVETKIETVFVYQYDGSEQCGFKKGVDLQEMQKKLSGIQVISAKKRNDGLMRTQVCGSATGEANVYEIRKKDLGFALKQGFLEWKF